MTHIRDILFSAVNFHVFLSQGRQKTNLNLPRKRGNVKWLENFSSSLHLASTHHEAGDNTSYLRGKTL